MSLVQDLLGTGLVGNIHCWCEIGLVTKLVQSRSGGGVFWCEIGLVCKSILVQNRSGARVRKRVCWCKSILVQNRCAGARVFWCKK